MKALLQRNGIEISIIEILDTESMIEEIEDAGLENDLVEVIEIKTENKRTNITYKSIIESDDTITSTRLTRKISVYTQNLLLDQIILKEN